MEIKYKIKKKYLIILVITAVLLIVSVFWLIWRNKKVDKLLEFPTVLNEFVDKNQINASLSEVLQQIARDTNLRDINFHWLYDDSEPFKVDWRKNDYIRFVRFPDFEVQLYRGYENKDDLLAEYAKIKTVLQSLGFSVDLERKTISGGDFNKDIINDFWTNGEEFITVSGLEFEGSIYNTNADLTISDLGTVNEIISLENEIEGVLDAFNVDFKKNIIIEHGESERKADYAKGIFVKVLSDNQLPILFTYYPEKDSLELKRQLLEITFQGGENGFVYYERNERTGNVSLILTSNNNYTCNDLKVKNISSFEAENILEILQNSENSWGAKKFVESEIEGLNLEKCFVEH